MKSTIEWLFLIRVFWLVGAMATSTTFAAAQPPAQIGREVAIPEHLQDGEEYELSIAKLIRYGQRLFEAHFTSEEGAGRPLTKGTGAPLSESEQPAAVSSQ